MTKNTPPSISDALIFVDANIYLDCYQRRYDNYRKLIGDLSPLASSILFTSAVDHEFRRNRVGAYIKENKVERGKTNIPIFSPHHEVTGDNQEAKAIRQKKEQIEKQTKELLKSVSEVHLKNIRAIEQGTDDVSQAIAPLRANLQTATDEQLQRARLRKELGNPPGKKGDPLGDQISWEQLLDLAPNKRSVWIVTNDNDYIERAEKEIFLGPFLYDELRERAPEIEVFCFSNLADFFTKLKQVGLTPVASSIPEERIKIAKEEYVANTAIQSTSFSSGPATVLITSPTGIRCHGSEDGEHDFATGLVAKPSAYGGLTYWATCQKCGFQMDTGEAYED
ncbi:PIN domain-containing protein [Microvirga pudoricolor]|uniref:PIN domain-containing protein n=1 Tax=Microvirga pudoricolor TaxID=2778729 RepID=UPI001951A70A|nr:PIN domain-containing protein [Microvirga pudoricolor]MBM6593088.1 DUF4935 domain-containing protein [Microvirga pudoricolor]